jgi:hypothetical protein
LVGKDEEPFVVHECALHARSPAVLETVLRRITKSGTSKTLRLQDTEPKIFSYYVHVLYGWLGKTDRLISGEGCPTGTYTAAHLWRLCESLEDHELCNTITDILLNGVKEGKLSTVVDETITMLTRLRWTTSSNSKLRKLFLDLLAGGPRSQMKDWSSWICEEFTNRYLDGEQHVGLLDKDGKVKREVYCRYHIHKPGEKCKKDS